jgi:undecaprenyl pyrophosphate phosphatase UppP
MGVTVAVGLLCGMSVRRVLEFSFLLEYPLILAAVVVRAAPWLCTASASAWVTPMLWLNLLVAGMVSYGVLWLARRMIAAGKSWIFGCYVLLCAAVLAWLTYF